ncbi:MAG TPA: hypothetical protein DCL21_01735 [Alphaproteobacteria bacterium]|nr:hypothetical protein [Alphaproteobacteria bacterium]
MRKLIVIALAIVFSAGAFANIETCSNGTLVRDKYIMNLTRCSDENNIKSFLLNIRLNQGVGDHFILSSWGEVVYKVPVREGLDVTILSVENYSGDYSFNVQLGEEMTD